VVKYKHSIKQIHFNELKRKVEAQFGVELINTHHARLLQDDILQRTNKNISASTITRMFVSSSYNNVPYLNTLDILSEYCTGKTWNQFCKTESTFVGDNRTNIDGSTLALLEICFQNEDFISVLDYLKYLPSNYDEVDIKTQQKLSNLFGVSIRNTNQRLALTKELAKTRQGRFLFYETFVDVDNLTGYYGEALEFYQKYGQSIEPSRKLNDDIFLQCMLFWRAWLLKDDIQLRKIGFNLFHSHQPHEIVGDNGIVFYPLARWHAYRLIYLKKSNSLNSKIVEDSILLLENQIRKFYPNLIVIVLSKLFEALLITGFSTYIYPLYLKYKSKINLGEVNNDTYLPLLHFVKLALKKEGKLQLADNIILPKLELDIISAKATYANLVQIHT